MPQTVIRDGGDLSWRLPEWQPVSAPIGYISLYMRGSARDEALLLLPQRVITYRHIAVLKSLVVRQEASCG